MVTTFQEHFRTIGRLPDALRCDTVRCKRQPHGRHCYAWEGKRGARKRSASIAVAALAAGLLGSITGVVLAPSSASAVSSPPEVTLRSDNVFNAYVAAGENLDVLFTKTAFSPAANNSDTTITVRGPGGITESCFVPAAAAVGTTCGFSDLTASVSGVWEIMFGAAGATSSYFSWSIDVQSGTTAVPGRVWTQGYNLYNTEPVDLSLTYVSEHGFQYGVVHSGYVGVDSAIASDSTGNTLAGTCIPAYKSYDRGTAPEFPYGDDDAYDPPRGDGSCGDRYKIFFESPAPDLPETAVWPDGSTSWLIPAVALPDVTSLVFDQNSYADRSGTFTLEVANYTGAMSVQVDVNNDGDYSDPEDVTLPVAIVDGAATVTWDGRDGLGAPAPIDTELSARAFIDRTGEIHFVSGDAEGRTGLQVTALNGPQAGDDVLYWDDSDLREEGRFCTTPVLDGTAGTSSGGGVHGWACAENINDGETGSWGDMRYIDDWTYTAVEEELAIPLPVLLPNLVYSKSVDPTSGTTVLPGQELTYTLTFQNTGDAPGQVNRVDDLTHVLDDATVTVAPMASDAALAVSEIANDRFSITGELLPGQTVTVTYTVVVNAAEELGDTELANFLLDPVDPPRPDPICEPGDPYCTYNDVPHITVVKSSDPASGTTVGGGQEVTYTLTFTNIGAGEGPVDRTDHMSGVLDDAELVAAPAASDPALSVEQGADSYRVTGTLAPDQSVTVSYTVRVHAWAQQGDHLLGNFVTVTGEEPPTACVEESRLCTEHPTQPPASSSGGDGDLAVTGGAAPIWAAALAAGLLAGGALLMIARRRNASRSEQ